MYSCNQSQPFLNTHDLSQRHLHILKGNKFQTNTLDYYNKNCQYNQKGKILNFTKTNKKQIK